MKNVCCDRVEQRSSCGVRHPDAAPVLIRFNYEAHAKVQVGQSIRSCLIAFLLLTLYVTL